jgi:hypothetical protein
MEGSGMHTVEGINLALFFQLNTLPHGSRSHCSYFKGATGGGLVDGIELMD